MNITRDVITDLLPAYLSGEASEDTRRLVEQYFRGNPDFERIARSAAKPVENLRRAPGLAPDQVSEVAAFEKTRRLLRKRRQRFALALFFSLVPFSFIFVSSPSHSVRIWFMLRDAPWDAVGYWVIAAICWWLYFRCGSSVRGIETR
jgi:hypothetical protein